LEQEVIPAPVEDVPPTTGNSRLENARDPTSILKELTTEIEKRNVILECYN
jgi:hypothetical protein